VALVPLLAGVVVFCDPWRRKSAAGAWFQVSTLDALKANIPQRVQIIGDRRDAWSHHKNEPIGAVFLVAAPGKTSVVAFNSTCPHAGCSVGFQPAKTCFVCPCHTSAFGLDGTALNAVSPRDMDSLECEVRGSGEVWVKFQDFLSGTPFKIPKA
jgi:menaquinol-cytochrome c reductase iron-sulfur subunit